MEKQFWIRGNTAWVMVATALVFFMTVPALALFYGGLVRKKNVLSILMQSFITVAIASAISFSMVTWIKERFGYDDSLDVFGCHGIGGLVGAILTGGIRGSFRMETLGAKYAELAYGNPKQLIIQLIASGLSIAVSLIGTFIIFKFVDLVIGVRVDEKSEAIGLDITQHNERAYTVIDGPIRL